MAGLCHDLGHGPFSHLFEHMVAPELEVMKDQNGKWKHEEASLKILQQIWNEDKVKAKCDECGLKDADLKSMKAMIKVNE